METLKERSALNRQARPELTLARLETPQFQAMRLSYEARNFGPLPELPRDNAYILAVKMRPLTSFNLFLSGKHANNQAISAGGMCLVHRDLDTHLDLQAPFDILQLHFPHRFLGQALDGDGGAALATLRCPPLSTLDPVITSLAHCLAHVIDHPQQASPLFLSHLALAVSSHLVHAYGDRRSPTPVRGGLVAWQLQRAQDMLAANLDGQLSIAALAAACGLSASHFATVFKRSTGVSPTSWLAQRRLEKARELLRRTDISLAE